MPHTRDPSLEKPMPGAIVVSDEALALVEQLQRQVDLIINTLSLSVRWRNHLIRRISLIKAGLFPSVAMPEDNEAIKHAINLIKNTEEFKKLLHLEQTGQFKQITPLPNDFFYSRKTGHTSFTRTPTGRLDIQQLLHSKPCWILPSSTELQKKKIIFSLWNSDAWTEETQKWLKTLCDNGFSIYVFSKNQIRPYQDQDGHPLSLRYNYPSGDTPDEDVLQRAISMGWPRDEVLILDDKKLEDVVNPSPKDFSYRIRLSTLLNLLYNPEKLVQYAKKLKEWGEKVLVDDCDINNPLDGIEELQFNKLRRLIKDHLPDMVLVNKEGIALSLATSSSHQQGNTTLPTPAPVDHNPLDQRRFKPKATDRPFAYSGKKNSKAQSMIIEQFSQYLTIKNKHLALIPKLQDGICNALSHLHATTSAIYWQSFINDIATWNGSSQDLTKPLANHFKLLLTFIQRYHLTNSGHSQHYLGDNWIMHLQHLPFSESCILSNPWHAISLKRLTSKSWAVYDPNDPGGEQQLSTDQLEGYLRKSIGNITMIESNNINPRTQIPNPDGFLAEGGLLALQQIDNPAQALQQLPTNYTYSPQALEGILLRNMKGQPAWVTGLSKPGIQDLVKNLLMQLHQQQPDKFATLLQESIELLTPFQKQSLIAKIIALFPQDPTQSSQSLSQDSLVQIIREAPEEDYYEEQLKTWHQAPESPQTLLEYSQKSLQHKPPLNRLIQLNSASEVLGLRFALEDLAQKTQRPLFYINSPDDLVCDAPFIQRRGNQGVIQKGPGGALHDFLIAHHHPNEPVLLVNYDNFSADDLVRLNTLIDKNRRVDNTPVPDNALIIGLMNTKKPNVYQGADFYSRFDKKERCPINASELEKAIPTIPLLEPKDKIDAQDKLIIDCFNADNWKERLLGRWILNGKELHYEPGPLSNLNPGTKALEIRNAPWHNPEFKRFWQEAMAQGQICHEGQTIQLPPDLKIINASGYDWQTLKNLMLSVNHQPVAASSSSQPDHILNPGLLESFLFPYRFDDSESSLYHIPSPIELAKNQTLNLCITRNLNEDEWAQLLSECRRHQVTLAIKTMPGVSIPQALWTEPLLIESITQPWTKTPEALITTTDIDLTVELLTKNQNDWIVIDVSECSPSDLLEQLDGHLNLNTLHFDFNQRTSWLKQALAEGKRIILKGQFSATLADQLAPMLLERQNQSAPSGELVLVTEPTHSIHYLPTTQHNPTLEEKREVLGQLSPEIESKLELQTNKEPLCTIRARINALKSLPEHAKNDQAWIGLEKLPLPLKTPEISKEDCINGRKEVVRSVLSNSPYVIITGASGVGKTTFISDILPNPEDKLYQTKEQIKAWAQDTDGPGYKLLFIDEATLSSNNWSLFEGLFSNPPGLLIDGIYYPLTNQHKVVFAGNPVSYGDERKLPALFKRHGNAVLFQPLPADLIKKDILDQIFYDQPNENTEAAIEHFLKIYRFIVACSDTDILITPRELEMMALLTKVALINHPDADPAAIYQHYAYQITKNLVPKAFKAGFDSRFKPSQPLIWNEQPKPNNNDFIITPTRQPIRSLLNDLLSQRQWRQTTFANNTSVHPEVQFYGGLGGLIIEGEPGIGKTEVVIKTLLDAGFQKANLNDPSQVQSNRFYHIPVALSQLEKEKLLLQAFNEGAVVLIDEINSSPMMENFLNGLLMGKGPNGERPQKPGFLLISTQNPINMAGRRAASTALSRRMIKEMLPPYPDNEMQMILTQKGLRPAQVQGMIKAYNKNRHLAQQLELTPLPTFRDLEKLANAVLRATASNQQVNTHRSLVQVIPASMTINELLNLFNLAIEVYLIQNNIQLNQSPKTKPGFFKAANPLATAITKVEEAISKANSKIEAINAIEQFIHQEKLPSFSSFLHNALSSPTNQLSASSSNSP